MGLWKGTSCVESLTPKSICFDSSAGFWGVFLAGSSALFGFSLLVSLLRITCPVWKEVLQVGGDGVARSSSVVMVSLGIARSWNHLEVMGSGRVVSGPTEYRCGQLDLVSCWRPKARCWRGASPKLLCDLRERHPICPCPEPPKLVSTSLLERSCSSVLQCWLPC